MSSRIFATTISSHVDLDDQSLLNDRHRGDGSFVPEAPKGLKAELVRPFLEDRDPHGSPGPVTC